MTRRFYLTFLLLATLSLVAVIGCSSGASSSASSTETGNPIYMDGTVQKGPFYAGAKVYIEELDNASLQPSGVVHTGKILNNLGEFEVAATADIAPTYVEVSVTGYFYNEITGMRSLFPISLSSFIDITQTQTTNINVLTTIAIKREKYLMVNGGKTYEEAKIQARNEILTAFKIPEQIIDDLQDGGIDTFTTMDIGQDGEKNAILLSLSIALSSYQQVSVWQAIQTIGDDIETDGVIDDAQYIDTFYESSVGLDISLIRTNLIYYYQSMSAWVNLPYFEMFLELFSRPYTGVKAPVFSLPCATYNQDIAVELYTVTADASIYYTINDSAPTLYTDPITISGDQTAANITAWTVGPDMSESDTVSSYYYIDYDYDPEQYNTDMTIDQFKSNIAGTWVGHIDPPAQYLSTDNVSIVIDDSMQYAAHVLSRYYPDSTGLNQAYFGWFGSEYYYGTAGVGTKVIDVTSENDDGKAFANIDNVFDNGNTVYFGNMNQIAISDDLNHLQFKFLRMGYYAPFVVDLTRIE